MSPLVKTVIFIVSFLILLLWSFLYLRIKEKSNVVKSVLLFMFVFSSFWCFVTNNSKIVVFWFVLALSSTFIASATLAISRFVLKVNLAKQWDYYVYLAIITASVLVLGYFALVGWALSSMGPLYH